VKQRIESELRRSGLGQSSIRQWLLLNLQIDPGNRLSWSFNLDTLDQESIL
jgi:hypothetical protein